jgi:hypothetical protein
MTPLRRRRDVSAKLPDAHRSYPIAPATPLTCYFATRDSGRGIPVSSEACKSFYVACSSTDPQANAVLDNLEYGHRSVVPSFAVFGDRPRGLAVRDALRAAEFALVVLPNVGHKDRTNVIFEAGVAMGCGLPILVIVDDKRLPRSLRGLPVLESSDLHRLEQAITDTWRTRRWLTEVRDVDSWITKAPSSLLELKPRIGASRFSAMTETDLVRDVAELLRLHGARVTAPEKKRGESLRELADLVIWDDGLHSTFGLPLPIEILTGTTSTNRIRAHAEETRRASGSQSIVAVTGEDIGNHLWSDGQGFVLSVTAISFHKALENRGVADGLQSLLMAVTA